MVCELFGGGESDHARDSLERVKAAEEIIEHRAIDRARIDFIFESNYRATYRDEMLVTLSVVIVEKLVEELATIVGIWCIHQVACSNEPTTSANCRGSK